eukprot:CAMPEP_0205832288 /NCGR_PEP_ID=MMETSP0206-20130828/46551_1 /ASSEMBLY_ACC=CAM_ASM_000279 /TAXON_ID=36767 /ORGANISM="Euplotes focardii, Strain TN1" /LENGTH=535 /DNA_ID=CAMNT_0053137685 /DNA_START=25 /DNA_END=1632 /DNA_ORIENTATION=+
MIQLIVLVLIAAVIYYVYTKSKEAPAPRYQPPTNLEEDKNISDIEFYDRQSVFFVEETKGYVPTLKSELESDLPHFNTLRTHALGDANRREYFGTKLGDETWLFPVSQTDLKEIYSLNKMNGKLESRPFNQSVGYAPRGMPFMKTNEHWKELRKSLGPIFHSDWMEAYLGYFNTAVKDLVKKWKSESGTVRNIKRDVTDMAFESALYSLTGSKLDVNIPYVSANGTKDLHIKDVNHLTLIDFAKHAATEEFIKDNEYRLKADSEETKRLNQNMDTLGGALTGLVEARAGQLGEGAEVLKTIVDAAYGLLVAGKIADVNEAVQHGWAILNGAHNNCGNALTAALYYLLKNPECYAKLKKEIDTELIKGENLDESNLETVVTHDNLHDLEYLNCVVKETLRLSSPIYGKPLKATEDIKFKSGFKVRKGTVIYPNNGVIGVSENIWSSPQKFIPERFDPESPYFKLPNGEKRDAIAWLAFGAGPRACMGDNFSMYFMKVGLVYFLHLFEFEFKDVNHEDGFFYWLNQKEFNAEVKVLA